MNDEIPFYYENQSTDTFSNRLKRVVTSSLLFMVSFIASNLLLQLLIAQMSKALKYTVHFSYNAVNVYPWDYHYWSRTNIVLIYFVSPVICFVLGLFLLNLLRVYSSWSNTFRIFFFWMSVTLINMVLTHLVLSPLGSPMDRNNGLYQTFSVVGSFLWLNSAVMVAFTVVALVASLGLGILVRKEVMRYSFSKKLIRTKEGMDSVVMQVYVLPVIAAAIPLLLLCSEKSFFTMSMQLINLVIVGIGIFLMNSIGIATVRCNKSDVLNHVPIIELIICVAAWSGVFYFLR